MRVALVCPYDLSKPGGVQQVVIELGKHLRGRGDEVVIVGPGDSERERQIRFHSVGGSMTMSANRSAVPIAVHPRAWNRTLEGIDDVDLVHVHEPFIPLVGWAGLVHRATPTVATFHADPPGWARRLYSTLAFMGQLAIGEVTTTASSPVSASAVPNSWGTPRIVPNAIDVATYDIEVERHPKRVAFLGRDDPRKGLSVLLDAWPAIRERHPDAELEVMGATRPDSLRGVRFRGPADEGTKRRVLASSGIYVAPNLGGESFGIVVAEGMAAGCAVVASDIAAFRYVLGDAGILVPPGDSNALATWVTRLLDDTEQAGSLGREARSAVKRFDWSVVLDRYRETYADALS